MTAPTGSPSSIPMVPQALNSCRISKFFLFFSLANDVYSNVVAKEEENVQKL